jgi:predicted branched-subunit amino acid permease
MSISQAVEAAGDGSGYEFRRGVASCAPVLLGTIPYALVLGAQATQKGLSTVELSVMTGLNFAGGSEFAAIQLWTSPPHIVLIVAITFLVNSRHLLMGAALAPFLHDLPRRKVFPALFFLCDESWRWAWPMPGSVQWQASCRPSVRAIIRARHWRCI